MCNKGLGLSFEFRSQRYLQATTKTIIYFFFFVSNTQIDNINMATPVPTQ